jgi:aminoglycoside 2'-N-acetyltransferase I
MEFGAGRHDPRQDQHDGLTIDNASTARVRRATTSELAPREIATLRRMMTAAFEYKGGTFDGADWQHAIGGVHVLVEDGREILSHGSLIERRLEIGGMPVRSGYVEAVATWPDHQHRGYGTLVMREIGDLIRADYGVGALSTATPAFYERLGWELWRGPTGVRTPRGVEQTPDDDGGIMILHTPTSPPLDLSAPIVCEWREGDVW